MGCKEPIVVDWVQWPMGLGLESTALVAIGLVQGVEQMWAMEPKVAAANSGFG